MDLLIQISQLIFALAIVIILHEGGHFLAARAFGIRVEKFYLFFDAFGKKLIKFKHKDTEYGIGWLPLGGYVKICGMIDESLDTGQLKNEPQPYEFRSKPAWQRLIVMLAGVTVNVITGIVFSVIYVFYYGQTLLPITELKDGFKVYPAAQSIGMQDGDLIIGVNGKTITYFNDIDPAELILSTNGFVTVKRNNDTLQLAIPSNYADILADAAKKDKNKFFIMPRFKFAIDSVIPNSAADSIGLAKGDSILKIDEAPILFFDNAQDVLQTKKGKTVTLLVARNGTHLQLPVNVSNQGTLGFYPQIQEMKTEAVNYNLQESFVIGNKRAWTSITTQLKTFAKMFSGDLSVKNISGPVGMVKAMSIEWDWQRMWDFIIVISMVLAFMNLLPIPGLDGGHALFAIYEMIFRRKVSDDNLIKIQVVGMVFLISLMLLVVTNDILSW